MSPSDPLYCGYCDSHLHTERNCPKTEAGQSNRRNMRCSYCGSKKHNIDACPKTWGGNADRAWHPESVANDFILDRESYVAK